MIGQGQADMELHDAVRDALLYPYEKWRIEDIRRLLELETTDVNHVNSTHSTPLSICIIKNKFPEINNPLKEKRVELLLLLLKHKANPNWKDRQGWTLLHQAAWCGDLTFIQTCVNHGKGDIRSRNLNNQLPTDLAVFQGHTYVMEYLDSHSGDLWSMCRTVIRRALGVRCWRLNDLPLPPGIKFFLNYNIPYRGFTTALIPHKPWTPDQLHRKEVGAVQLQTFIRENASGEFLDEHKETLRLEVSEEKDNPDQDELSRLFQNMYLWESFKKIEFEEPLPRKPRYSLTKLNKKSEEKETKK